MQASNGRRAANRFALPMGAPRRCVPSDLDRVGILILRTHTSLSVQQPDLPLLLLLLLFLLFLLLLLLLLLLPLSLPSPISPTRQRAARDVPPSALLLYNMPHHASAI